MFGGQDCSRFLCEIFSTVGIKLPRNSSWQADAGKVVAEFTSDMSDEEKLAIIMREGIPGVTLLRMPGHIMLYLGTYNEKPYVIHSIWAYREHIRTRDIIRLINKTAVSDLSPGEGTKKGSLLRRITKMTNIY